MDSVGTPKFNAKVIEQLQAENAKFKKALESVRHCEPSSGKISQSIPVHKLDITCKKCGGYHALDECPRAGTQLQHQISDEDFQTLNKTTNFPLGVACPKNPILRCMRRTNDCYDADYVCKSPIPGETLRERRERKEDETHPCDSHTTSSAVDVDGCCISCGADLNHLVFTCDSCPHPSCAHGCRNLQGKIIQLQVTMDRQAEKVKQARDCSFEWQKTAADRNEVIHSQAEELESTKQILKDKFIVSAEDANYLRSLPERLLNAEAENTMLKEALKIYGTHTDYCGTRWTVESPRCEPCDCGFKDALMQKP